MYIEISQVFIRKISKTLPNYNFVMTFRNVIANIIKKSYFKHVAQTYLSEMCVRNINYMFELCMNAPA